MARSIRAQKSFDITRALCATILCIEPHSAKQYQCRSVLLDDLDLKKCSVPRKAGTQPLAAPLTPTKSEGRAAAFSRLCAPTKASSAKNQEKAAPKKLTAATEAGKSRSPPSPRLSTEFSPPSTGCSPRSTGFFPRSTGSPSRTSSPPMCKVVSRSENELRSWIGETFGTLKKVPLYFLRDEEEVRAYFEVPGSKDRIAILGVNGQIERVRSQVPPLRKFWFSNVELGMSEFDSAQFDELNAGACNLISQWGDLMANASISESSNCFVLPVDNKDAIMYAPNGLALTSTQMAGKRLHHRDLPSCSETPSNITFLTTKFPLSCNRIQLGHGIYEQKRKSAMN